jgi:hypothetical protein
VLLGTSIATSNDWPGPSTLVPMSVGICSTRRAITTWRPQPSACAGGLSPRLRADTFLTVILGRRPGIWLRARWRPWLLAACRWCGLAFVVLMAACLVVFAGDAAFDVGAAPAPWMAAAAIAGARLGTRIARGRPPLRRPASSQVLPTRWAWAPCSAESNTLDRWQLTSLS